MLAQLPLKLGRLDTLKVMKMHMQLEIHTTQNLKTKRMLLITQWKEYNMEDDKPVEMISVLSDGTYEPVTYVYDSKKRELHALTEGFLSREQILEDLPTRMSKEDLTALKDTPLTELIKFHHGLGRWMRNNYGLWFPENPHIVNEHPDDYSFSLITQLWNDLNNDNAFDRAMEDV